MVEYTVASIYVILRGKNQIQDILLDTGLSNQFDYFWSPLKPCTLQSLICIHYTIQIVVNVGSCYKLIYYIYSLLYFKSQRSTEGPLTVAFETIGRYLLKYFHPCAEMQRRKLCKCQDDLLKFLWKQFRKGSYGSGEIHIPKQ